jgi:aspartate aminotransferase
MIDEYKRRRDWLVPALNAIEGVECTMPEGAFYVFPSIGKLLGPRIKSSDEFAQMLLDRARVAVTAGSGFGIEGHIRISYAASLDLIQKGVARMAEAIDELKKGE